MTAAKKHHTETAAKKQPTEAEDVGPMCFGEMTLRESSVPYLMNMLPKQG
jgi:hypothetical protein